LDFLPSSASYDVFRFALLLLAASTLYNIADDFVFGIRLLLGKQKNAKDACCKIV
jgi:hypothetical protein